MDIILISSNCENTFRNLVACKILDKYLQLNHIFLLFSECIDEEMFYNFYEEIPDSPIGILRTPDLELLSNDNDSMIPRPKLGWPIRKVTFGKWKIFISVRTIIFICLLI